jgi:hypothetical protein
MTSSPQQLEQPVVPISLALLHLAEQAWYLLCHYCYCHRRSVDSGSSSSGTRTVDTVPTQAAVLATAVLTHVATVTQ